MAARKRVPKITKAQKQRTMRSLKALENAHGELRTHVRKLRGHLKAMTFTE